ncbi:hypothetical protein [Acuticoccus kandeliae]|uniref:hypothetical protein n=1 Tax=Acuticoccus kandeliae TaxID=2073160 RepID=UPI000D3EAD75|nr:hypothetical protein [Acuticoccus kandeliae]
MGGIAPARADTYVAQDVTQTTRIVTPPAIDRDCPWACATGGAPIANRQIKERYWYRAAPPRVLYRVVPPPAAAPEPKPDLLTCTSFSCDAR